MYICSFVIVLGCDSWFLVWFGLEVNMIGFIAIIYSRSMISIEGCMKYFFIQSVGSGVLLASLYFDVMNKINLVSLILGYKMGGGPFFFWFPSLCESLSWASCMMLMTFQKVMPLLLMSLFMGMIVWLMILFSLVIGVMGSFNEKKLKKLLAFSSIHHLGWLMVGNYMGSMVWMFYWLGYFFMLGGLIVLLRKECVLSINDLNKINMKLVLIMNMLNLGGMPPMFGFFLKWGIFYFMVECTNMYIMFMIIMSVVMLYVYLRLIFMIMSKGISFCYNSEKYFMSSSEFISGSLLMMSVILGSLIMIF